MGEIPKVIHLEGGSVERVKDYNRWSIEGVRSFFRSRVQQESSETEWLSTKVQDDDYVVVGFPAEIAENFAQPFVSASGFWNNVVGDTSVDPISFDGPINIGDHFGRCLTNPEFVLPKGQAIRLLILAEVEEIDGEGTVLGSAGPCFTVDDMPRIGTMRFDVADVNNLIEDGSFTEVIKHEMGHVLGLGASWENLVLNRCLFFNPCDGNPTYIGQNALDRFNQLGGTGELLVANVGGAGTANVHWREKTFNNELMVTLYLLILLADLLRFSDRFPQCKRQPAFNHVDWLLNRYWVHSKRRSCRGLPDPRWVSSG